MKIIASIAAAAMLAVLGAGSPSHRAAQVPNLSGSVTPASGHSATQTAALHAAAQCVRTHGVPAYQDPVVSADGHVYTDLSPDELPANGALGKGDETAERAYSACRHEQYAEIAASTLRSLAHD